MKYGAFYLVQKANNVYVCVRISYVTCLSGWLALILKMVTATVVYSFQLQNQNYRSHKHLTPDSMKKDIIFIILFGLHIISPFGMVSQ